MTDNTIQFPIEISDIELGEFKPIRDPFFGDRKKGMMVAIRPCADKYKDKTYLGVYLGDVTLGVYCAYNPTTKKLKIEPGMGNPAIFVPELNEVILGCESFWGEIKDEKHLRKITDEDIQNVWYIKALKQLEAKEKGE